MRLVVASFWLCMGQTCRAFVLSPLRTSSLCSARLPFLSRCGVARCSLEDAGEAEVVEDAQLFRKKRGKYQAPKDDRGV